MPATASGMPPIPVWSVAPSAMKRAACPAIVCSISFAGASGSAIG
jgi:hypothetical protein